MDFLKKNYEKVILSLVLLGLAVAAVWLFLSVSTERESLENVKSMNDRITKVALAPLDLSTNEAILKRLRRPEPPQLGREHNLFNPVVWQRRPDGSLVKIVMGNELGAGALTITRINPLRTVISYEGMSTNLGTPLFRFKVAREAHRDPRKRSPITMQAAGAGSKNEIFVLREARPKEDPAEFLLDMLEDRTQVTVTKDKPYEGVAGHMVDLKYDPEKQVFLGKRVDDRLVFAGDTNRIVSIEADSVTVEAVSNKKRTTLKASAGVGSAPAR